jgi:hypothetical protein
LEKIKLVANDFFQNTQTLQLLTMNIKTESIYKSYKNAKLLGLVDVT